MTGNYQTIISIGKKLVFDFEMEKKSSKNYPDISQFAFERMKDIGIRLDELGKIAVNLFDVNYDDFMEEIHKKEGTD